MEVLDAVNELLDAINESQAAALDTGETSLEGQAEAFIDRYSQRIQRIGWHCNTLYNVEIDPPDTTIAYTVAPTGTFLAGETVTETTSGATGRFHEIVSSKLYITQASDSTADFAGSLVLTGSTSAATVTGTTLDATITEGRIVLDTDVLSADSYGASASVDVAVRGGALWDVKDATDVFDSTLLLTTTVLLDFDVLPQELAEYILSEAACAFHAKLLGQTRELNDLRDRRDKARQDAYKYDAIKGGKTMLDTAHAYQTLGYNIGRQTR